MFEAASVKAAAPGGGGGEVMKKMALDSMMAARPAGSIPMLDQSRISLHGRTLASLIAAAYKVSIDQVSGPKWLSELTYDIDATLPQGAPASSVNAMLQALLEERFALRVHEERKEAAGYVLAVAKGGAKLTPAGAPEPPMDLDKVKRSGDEAQKTMAMAKMAAEAQQGAAGGDRGLSSMRWVMKGATMAQLAARLTQVIHAPVEDGTALTGKYDLDLVIQYGGDEDPAAGAAQGVAKFGLKLEPRKLPRVSIVVDSATKTPVEN